MPVIETPPPKAQRLLAVIAGEIARGRIVKGDHNTFLAFSEVLELLGSKSPLSHAGSRLNKLGLKELHEWIEEHEELPKVTALIVYKNGRLPHWDFRKWHGHEHDPNWQEWWMEEANRAIDFNWSPYVGIVRYKRVSKDFRDLRVREDRLLDRIDVSSASARLRLNGVAVSEVLRWMSRGMSEADILQQHRELHRDDIRASLAYAAEKEERLDEVQGKLARLDRFTERWGSKFTLANSDPDDPRMDYLLKRYWDDRQ